MPEGITWIKQQFRFTGDEGRPGDARYDGISCGFVGTFKDGPDDTLLLPRLPGLELAIRSQASKLGTGAGTTGGTVVGTSRTENEVLAVCAVR